MRNTGARVGASLLLLMPIGWDLARPRLSASVPVTLSVPAEPIPVRAAGSTVLVYELHVVNEGTQSLRLERLAVRAASTAGSTPAAPLVAYDRREIERNVKFIGPRGASAPRALAPGVRAVLYVWLAFASPAEVPRTLSHEVTFGGGGTAQGGTVAVRPAADLVLAAPVGAGDWWIGLGPSNTSEHRRSVIRVGEDPTPHLAQRFAIDWVRMDARREYARDGKGRRNADWYGYGEAVRAAADASVAAVVDGVPDNTPGENSRAVPMKVDTVLDRKSVV